MSVFFRNEIHRLDYAIQFGIIKHFHYNNNADIVDSAIYLPDKSCFTNKHGYNIIY